MTAVATTPLRGESPPLSLLSNSTTILRLAWAFTESNMFTFVIPNTLFGLASALAGPVLLDQQPPSQTALAAQLSFLVVRSLPVFLFNFINLLNFDLSNQRFPESVKEDEANKPWRPVPTGMISPEETRRTLLYTVPLALTINFALGAWQQGLFIEVLIWYYNDLRGGDELSRDAIIAVAYGLFNHGSFQIAAGSEGAINQHGIIWMVMISGVILTTMHIQDLKDQEGDKRRGRKTIALVYGDGAARRALAWLVPFWSLACPSFWMMVSLHSKGMQDSSFASVVALYAVPIALGGPVAWSVLFKQTPADDARTWKLWCLWHTFGLYFLPVISRFI